MPPSSRRRKIIHEVAPGFQQILVDDLLYMSDDGRFRVVFGTISPDERLDKRTVVSLLAEAALDEDMAEELVDNLSRWLRKQKKKGKRSKK